MHEATASTAGLVVHSPTEAVAHRLFFEFRAGRDPKQPQLLATRARKRKRPQPNDPTDSLVHLAQDSHRPSRLGARRRPPLHRHGPATKLLARRLEDGLKRVKRHQCGGVHGVVGNPDRDHGRDQAIDRDERDGKAHFEDLFDGIVVTLVQRPASQEVIPNNDPWGVGRHNKRKSFTHKSFKRTVSVAKAITGVRKRLYLDKTQRSLSAAVVHHPKQMPSSPSQKNPLFSDLGEPSADDLIFQTDEVALTFTKLSDKNFKTSPCKVQPVVAWTESNAGGSEPISGSDTPPPSSSSSPSDQQRRSSPFGERFDKNECNFQVKQPTRPKEPPKRLAPKHRKIKKNQVMVMVEEDQAADVAPPDQLNQSPPATPLYSQLDPVSQSLVHLSFSTTTSTAEQPDRPKIKPKGKAKCAVQPEPQRRQSRFRTMFDSLVHAASEQRLASISRRVSQQLASFPPKVQRLQRASTKRINAVQEAVYDILERPHGTYWGRMLHRVIGFCIFLNIAMLAVQTMEGRNYRGSDPMYPFLPAKAVYDSCDMVFTIIFTLEFVGRIFAKKFARRLLRDPLVWLDVVSLTPSYMLFFFSEATEFDEATNHTTLMRLIRILRIVKVMRHHEASRVLYLSLKASFVPLSITLFFLGTVVLILGAIVFYAEPCYDINTCTFTDIFNAAYFIMVTIATVGYGSQTPNLRNWLSTSTTIVAMIFGNLYFAMPLAIVGQNFQDTYTEFERQTKKLRHVRDETLISFESFTTEPNAHRLVEIYYHLHHAWIVLTMHIELFINEARGRNSVKDPNCDTDETRQELSIQIDQAIQGLQLVHVEACRHLEVFLPGVRRSSKESTCHSSRWRKQSSDALQSKDQSLAGGPTQDKQEEPKALLNPTTVREQLWLILESPESSRTAYFVNKLLVFISLCSIFVFCCESLPELYDDGIETHLCRTVVEGYCGSQGNGIEHKVAGCFTQRDNTTTNFDLPLRFDCEYTHELPECYGNGINFGSIQTDAPSCLTLFDDSGIAKICNNPICNASPVILDMEGYWIYFEWTFGVVFIIEISLRVYACHDLRRFGRDLYNVVDLIAILPFISEAVQFSHGIKPTYVMVSSDLSVGSTIRLFKTLRILKLTRHFRSTKILARTARQTWRQLMIPLFFLGSGCLLAAALILQIEMGTECYIGSPCYWHHKQILTKALSGSLPHGKMVRIQDQKTALIVDLERANWMTIVTSTTVGYGDFVPRTSLGRVVVIFLIVFSAVYCAMPYNLIGGTFYSLYQDHVEAKELCKNQGLVVAMAKPGVLRRRSSMALYHFEDDDYAARTTTSRFKDGKVKLSPSQLECAQEFVQLDTRMNELLVKLQCLHLKHSRPFQNRQSRQYLSQPSQASRASLVNDGQRASTPSDIAVVEQEQVPAPPSPSPPPCDECFVWKEIGASSDPEADEQEAQVRENVVRILDTLLRAGSLFDYLSDAPVDFAEPKSPATTNTCGTGLQRAKSSRV